MIETIAEPTCSVRIAAHAARLVLEAALARLLWLAHAAQVEHHHVTARARDHQPVPHQRHGVNPVRNLVNVKETY